MAQPIKTQMMENVYQFDFDGVQVPFRAKAISDCYVELRFIYPGCNMVADYYTEERNFLEEGHEEFLGSMMKELAQGIVEMKRSKEVLQAYCSEASDVKRPMEKAVSRFLMERFTPYTPEFWGARIKSYVADFLEALFSEMSLMETAENKG